MELKEIVQTLEEIAPPELADDFDKGRIGLILGLEDDVSRIAVALDANSYVLKKAAELKADMLITHHTLIFHPVNIISKSLADSLRIALENGISLYSMHTNYDRAEGGINDVLAARLGLKNIRTSEILRISRMFPIRLRLMHERFYHFAMYIQHQPTNLQLFRPLMNSKEETLISMMHFLWISVKNMGSSC